MTTWFRFVPHPLVAKMLAKGWTIMNPMDGNRRGARVVIMQWEGVGDPE